MLEVEFPVIVTFLSAALAFVLGMLWYHPKVLGEKWMKARGKGEAPVKMNVRSLFVVLILWTLAACFYSFLVDIMMIKDVPGFFALSCLLWVAFAMPPLVMGMLYNDHSLEAVSIDASYQLAGYYIFALMHIIAGAL